jgi:hypothetical protein
MTKPRPSPQQANRLSTMFRSILALAAVPALATLASAQCYVSQLGTLLGTGDDLVFTHQAMNITFPIGASNYTHISIGTNGVAFLGTATPPITTTTGYPSLATFAGGAGTGPRIAANWSDLEFLTSNNAGVYYNDTIPGKFVITWLNAWEWATTNPIFTVQAQLFANGDVIFTYTGNTQSTASDNSVGISAGNGIASVADVNLSAGGNASASYYMRELFVAGTFDLGGSSLNFTQAGGGFVQTISACNAAYNQAFGTGCYNISDSFYEFHTDSSTIPAALNGQSMSLTPAGSTYLVQWGGPAYVAPSASALTLTISDDSELAVTPSIPLPSLSGPVSPIYVHGNGMVSHGPNNGIQPISYVPDVAGFLSAPATGFFCWHDFNTSEAGSGQIKYHEAVVGADTIAYITWDDVESYASPEVANRSTWQIQLNLTSGVVTFAWSTMDGNPSSIYGSAYLVGWGPIGASSDGGNVDISAAAPFVTNTSNMNAMTLAGAPAPISSATSGTVVTYTTNNIPEFVPASGIYISTNILSTTTIPGGLNLAILGAPGCMAYIGTLDFLQVMVGGPTNSVTLPVPAGVPAGTILYSQTAALITPNSLPNGQNAFGLTVSNAVKSYIAPF